VDKLKETILRLLKERSPEYVSGEEICRLLNVTRTAVWKHIQSLRENGYEIEARSRAGYLLTGVPDRLFPEEIGQGLSTRFLGRNILYCDSVPSTNNLAKELAAQGAADGTIVVAEEQTSGKGRLGRQWSSVKYKGLFFTVILYPPLIPSEANVLTLMTAVAMAEAIRNETGVAAGIKWPNDLLVDGKKICGILVELSAEMERINYIVVGVGVNVNQEESDFPEEVRLNATSLKAHTGAGISRVKLLQSFLKEFEKWYDISLAQGFAPALSRWKEMSVSLNCPVRISNPKSSWDGWAEDIDNDGALLVRLPGGELKRAISGEVSLRLSE